MKKTTKLLTTLSALIFAFCIPITGCSTTSTPPPENSDNLEVSINSFNDYEWGTDMDTIKSKEITPDMKKSIDYSEENSGDMIGLSINGGDVSGIETRSVGYIFSDNKLSAGVYDLTINDTEYSDLLEKYTSIYGEASLTKESTGWGGCSLWIDGEHNVVCISGTIGIAYIQNGSPYMNYIGDMLTEFHEINLQEEINKIGNTDDI